MSTRELAPPRPDAPPHPPPQRGRAIRTRRRSRPDVARLLLIAAALLVALAGVHVLLRDVDWWFAAAAILALALVVPTLARLAGAPAVVASLLGVAATVGGLVLGFAPATAIAGVVPTADTVDRLVALVSAGWQSIAEQRVPAVADPGIVFLLCAVAGLAGLLAEALVHRAAALAVLPVLAILAVPVVIRGGLADPVVGLVAGALALLALRVPRPGSTVAGTVLIGAPVLVAALLVPPVAMPEVGGGLGPTYATGLNPLVSLGRDLRRDDPVEAGIYRTDGADPVYLRLSTLSVLDEAAWRLDEVRADGVPLADGLPGPTGLAPEVAAVPVTAAVELGAVSSRWLPVPYPATALRGLDGEWESVRSLAVRSDGGNAFRQSYEVDYLEVSPSAEQLRAAGAAPPGFETETFVPETAPAVIAATAAEVTARASTPYDRALALQSWLRGPDFTYSVETPLEQGYDGADLDVVAAFLDERRGYCTHFAATMAVMARTLGIPARIAVGFQPGRSQLVEFADGDGESERGFVLTTHDLHAWPELYLDGVGWTRFEPTPGRGDVPDVPVPLPAGEAAPPVARPDAPAPAPSSTATRDPDGLPIDDDEVPLGDAAGSTDDGTALGVVSGVVVVLLAIVAAAPGGWRAWRRRRRLGRIRRGADAAAAAWAELRDTARDVGWLAPDTETPRALAARLELVVGDREVVGRLRAAVERSAFAPGGAAVDPDDVHDVRAEILATASWRERMRAALLPPSVVAALGGEDEVSAPAPPRAAAAR